MGVKMNLRIITKNHSTNPEIGFLTKSISKPNGHATAMPTAWELNMLSQINYFFRLSYIIFGSTLNITGISILSLEII